MIAGIGTDITGLDRLERLLEGARGSAFLERALTERERELASAKKAHRHRYVEFVAGRWAAKEAVVKALGCGIGAIVGGAVAGLLPPVAGDVLLTMFLVSGILRVGSALLLVPKIKPGPNVQKVAVRAQTV